MSDQIKPTDLEFSGTLIKRRLTKRVIIHHSASPDVPAGTIHGWHLGRGWSGIGYHFVIRTDGTIERGRMEWAIGSHSGPEGNADSIGIVLTGNFETGEPDSRQLDSLVWLLKDYLMPHYGTLEIQGHKEVMSTACPGKNFPWAEVNKRLEGTELWKEKIIEEALEAGLISERHKPDEPATKWFVLAVALNLLRKLQQRK